MSQAATEYVKDPVGIKEARELFPDVDQAVDALKEHEGELFADFNDVCGLAVGVIPENAEDAVSFYNFRGPNQPAEHGQVHVSIQTVEGVEYSFGRIYGASGEVERGATQIDGSHDTYVGWRAIHNNPYAVFTAEDLESAKQVDPRRALIIGDRACGAFAYGQALRDIEGKGSTSLQTSKALLLATELVARKADWRPYSGEESVPFDEAAIEIADEFERGALVPLVLARLGLKGSQWSIEGDAIATRFRTAILGYGMSSRDVQVNRLIDRMNFQIANDDSRESPQRKLALLTKAAERYGNPQSYIREAVDNILKNQVGVPEAY